MDIELLVFNLEEYGMIVPQYSEDADGKRVRKVKRYYPEAWKNSFGMTYREHKQSIAVDIDAHYMLHNARDGGESNFALTQREIRGEALKPSGSSRGSITLPKNLHHLRRCEHERFP